MNDDIIAAALADVGEAEKQAQLKMNDDDIVSVEKLSNEMIRIEDAVKNAEAALKTLNQNLGFIKNTRLPEAMEKAGLKSVELESGAKVSVTKKYIGSIKEENQDAALAWLKETKRHGIITPVLKVETEKGHLEEAEKMLDKIKGLGINASMKPSVHWQTLRGLTRELYESGEAIPDCLSTHVLDEAKIKRK